ncbi:hypothetical protein [Roseateles sp.]|uniref:hypothetical protein n=1 Tax=Roseateles sp. TaxID=1971397 RepID=UPI0039E85AF8
MGKNILKIGEATENGYVVAELLGQGPAGVVFIAEGDHLRWIYYKNKGVLPDYLRLVVAKFDGVLADIKAIKTPVPEKRYLYELLGKTLYSAFAAEVPINLETLFSDVERRSSSLTSKLEGPSGSRSALSADLVVICALHAPELESVLDLAATSSVLRIKGDPQTYHTAEWVTNKGTRLKVVLAAPNQMGLTASGVLAAKMIMQFQPKMVAMAGIAAGTRRGKQGFGDVIAPEHTFDLGDGKSVDSGHSTDIHPSPKPLSVHPRLLGRLKEWQRTRFKLDDIKSAWPANTPASSLSLHTGPLFSVPTVQNTMQTVKKALSQWRKLSGLEMEAHAIHRACTDTIDPPPMFLCAKSICDFAKGKGDEWQHYASFTSARFIHAFVTCEWEDVTTP